MEPQRPPPPHSAAPSHHQHHGDDRWATPSPDSDYIDEKSAYHQHHVLRIERGSKSSTGRGRDSVISHPFSPKQSSPPSPCSSVSSAGRQHRSRPDTQYPSDQISSHRGSITYPPQAHFDPEKHGYSSSRGQRSQNRVSGLDADAVVYDQGEYQERAPEEKAWQILLYLSGPCALLSLIITLWTTLALLISLALAPLQLCSTRRPLAAQLTTFLAPALNLQLHLVYSHNAATGYSAPMLVVIHLFSPLVACGVAIAAWTAAAFWIFTSILGDPGGNDGHNDGKESILGVRTWWERWLSRALREATV